MDGIEVKMNCEENTQEHPCQYAPAVKANLLVDLAHPYLHIQGVDLTSNKTMMDQVVNICSHSRNSGGQPGLDIFIKLVYELLKRSLNFELQCPFKKVTRSVVKMLIIFSHFQGLYTTRFYRNSFGLLLNFFKVNQTQRYTAKLKNRFGKTMENVFVYRADFAVVEVDDWSVIK